MKKKVISMLLATAMTATVFAGCGSEEDAAPSSGGNTNQEANDGGAGDAGDTEDAQGGEEQGETPADDGETAEIVVGLLSFAPVDSAVQDRIEEAVNEKMLEMINVTADFQWYDASTYATQIPMMIQSGEQLDAIMDNLILNENRLLTEEGIRHFTILASRTTRYLGNVLNLRDYVTQMREAYQAQIDIEQNNLMRLFTVITTVFQPLTLMAGWYGMNFTNMPELHWKYAYVVFIAVSVFVCITLLTIFKKKRWF